MLFCGNCTAMLLTNTSSLPNVPTALSIAALAADSSFRLQSITRHFLPCCSTSRLVSPASLRSLRKAMATSAPSIANATAAAWPMPLSPPVTTMALSFSLPAACNPG